MMNGAWSRVDIYDGDTLIGTLGYNVIPGEADETDDLMAVYNAPGVSGRYPDGQINRGVVAYDRETGTYVAFDLDAGQVTKQQARRIAEQLGNL